VKRGAAILLRSGIGPSVQLQSSGIEVVHESPGVGENLSGDAAIFFKAELPKPARRDVADGYPVGCLVRFL
jgi:choline dehydrogenase-like flavoprotein